MDYYSPLRYPGGKRKVSAFFKKVLKDNLLYDCTYIEPYAGGASVALSLLFNEYASRIVINDIDKSIYAFWHSVLNKTDELNKLIHDTKVDVASWKYQKGIQIQKETHDLLALGFSTFFLNRTNRSGIITAGIIGGKEQASTWKIDARFNKQDLIKRIERIAQYKDSITLYNLDALKLLSKLQKSKIDKVLFYFDPPYYIKGKALYLNFYEHHDHKKVADEICKIQSHSWVVTYDNVQAISDLYSGYRQRTFDLNYSAGKVGKGEELMIFSDNLFISDYSMFK